MKTLLCLLLVLTGCIASAQEALENIPGFDSYVSAFSSDDEYLYVGGSIRAAGNNVANALLIDYASGAQWQLFEDDSRVISASVYSQQGTCWYVASVSGNEKMLSRLSVFDDNGTVIEEQNLPIVYGNINAMLLIDSMLYLGGRFDSLGYVDAGNLARINLNKGEVDTTWTAGLYSKDYEPVSTLTADENYLYIGGNFDSINHQLCKNLGRVQLADGKLDKSWMPGPDRRVKALLLDADTLYVGGYFEMIGGYARNKVARLDKNKGWVHPGWTASSRRGEVNVVFVIGEYLYAGGDFDRYYNGSEWQNLPHTNLQRIEKAGGIRDSLWRPAFNCEIVNMGNVGGELLAGGPRENDFNVRDSTLFSTMAVFDTQSGKIKTNFNGQLYGYLLHLSAANNKILASGIFQLSNYYPLKGLARIHRNTNEPDRNWAPESDWFNSNNFSKIPVNMCTAGEALYVALASGPLGLLNRDDDQFDFYRMGILPVRKIDRQSGLIDENWLPKMYGEASGVAAWGEYIYVAGDLASAGADSIPYLLRMNAQTGTIDKHWNLNLNGVVHAIEVHNDMLYLCGEFTSVGNIDQPYLARVGLATGEVDKTWKPEMNSTVYRLLVHDELLYCSGAMIDEEQIVQFGLLALDLIEGKPLETWSPSDTLYFPLNMVFAGNSLAVVGYNRVGATMLTRMDRFTGKTYSKWQPSAYVWMDAVATLLCTYQSDDILYLGGFFNQSEGEARLGLDACQLKDPLIKMQPSGQHACGENEMFVLLLAESTTDTLWYQWQEQHGSGIWDDIPDASDRVLTIAPGSIPDEGLWVRCRVSDLNGAIVSDSALLVSHPEYTVEMDTAICEGASINWQGAVYDTAGSYQQLLSTSKGCDSLLVLNLETLASYHTVEYVSVCEGESLDWGGTTYTEAGSYQLAFTTTAGCDSSFVLELEVKESFRVDQSASFCEGGQYYWQGKILHEPGVYTDSLLSVGACDSVLVLDLKEWPVYESSTESSICQGESYRWNQRELSEAGFYSDTLSTVNECDSIVHLQLNIVEVETGIQSNGPELSAMAEVAVYQWVRCDAGESPIEGATSRHYVAVENGSYAVWITQNDCSARSSCVEVKGLSTGTSLQQGLLHLYPNPSAGSVQVIIEAALVNASLSVFDMTGQCVYRQHKIRQQNCQLDLQHLPAGVYQLQLLNNGTSSFRSFVIGR